MRYLCSQGWKVLQVFRCYETHIYVSVEVPNARCAENNRVVWVKRRTEDVWGWKRCTQQSSFSLTALSHGHTLLRQSTHSYNSCFVSWVMFCSAVVSLWGVFFLPLQSVVCRFVLQLLLKVGNSFRKNDPNQMLQIKDRFSQVVLIKRL